MYEWASEFFELAGYIQYEISNWAKDIEPSTFNLQPTFACKHNLQYWRGLPYLAFGAGAHGYANGYRYSNVLRIKTYIDRLNTDSIPIGENWLLNTEFPSTARHRRMTWASS
jgi:oxygen-independent coproporphyrinogen-3 oxidase